MGGRDDEQACQAHVSQKEAGVRERDTRSGTGVGYSSRFASSNSLLCTGDRLLFMDLANVLFRQATIHLHLLG